jgi:4-hydroxybenzoyl-CoA reductase subunit beta
MLRLPSFRLHQPATLDEAARILADVGPGARVVAGGTDLWPNLKRRHQKATDVVSLARVAELRGIAANGDLTLGAMETLTDVERHPAVRERFPALARAVGWISSPVLRNMGTIGGNLCLDTRCTYYDQNLEWRRAIAYCMKKDGDTCWVAPSSPRCWAVQSSDLAPVMVALDARVVLAGPDGERTIPASALYHDDGMAFVTKRPEELLVRVEVPALAGARASYRKLRRRGAFDFPVLGVAAWAAFDGAGKVRSARIVLGAVGSCPKPVPEAADLLVGGTLADDQLDAAVRLAGKLAKPLDNTDFTIGWRKEMASDFVRRALEALRGN